jgi:hypothetical protein
MVTSLILCLVSMWTMQHLDKTHEVAVMVRSEAAAVQASGSSTVTYFNGSQYDLYVYVAMAPQGTTIDCNTSARYQGSVSRNVSFPITIPAGQWAHIRFQRKQDGGCDERNTQLWSQAVANGKNERVNIQ